jgi:YD repeat-containing protein
LAFGYGYDNEGRLTSIAYPDLFLAYTYDALGRPVKLTDGNGIDWVKDAVWGPAGELQKLTRIKQWNDPWYGNIYMTENFAYNSRLQPTRHTVIDDLRFTVQEPGVPLCWSRRITAGSAKRKTGARARK